MSMNQSFEMVNVKSKLDLDDMSSKENQIQYFFYEFVIAYQKAKNKINIFFCWFFTFTETPYMLLDGHILLTFTNISC